MRLLGALSQLKLYLEPPKPTGKAVSIAEIIGWMDSFSKKERHLEEGNKLEAKLSDYEQQLAKAYNLFPSKENIRSFLLAAKEYEGKALGPGCEEKEAITRLQEDLQRFGFSVTPSGEYDQETMDAVMAFKRAHGLHDGYRMEDGAWAINEYATPQTLAEIAELGRRRRLS